MRTKPKVWTTCPRISEPRYRKRSLPFRSPRGGWSLGAGRASICSSIAARRTGGRSCSTFWASRCWRCVDKKLPQFVWRMNSSRSIHPDQGSYMPQLLAPSAVSLMSFVCTFATAVSGMVLRKKLPDDHLSEDSKDVIKLVMGLIATMAALVLGLLIASANSSYETQSGELQQVSATIVELDGILAQYGPEASEPRHRLRAAVSAAVDKIWSKDGIRLGQPAPAAVHAEAAGFYDSIQNSRLIRKRGTSSKRGRSK